MSSDLFYSVIVNPGVVIPVVNGIPLTAFDASQGDVAGKDPSDFELDLYSYNNLPRHGLTHLEVCPPVGPEGSPFDYYGYVLSRFPQATANFLSTWLPALHFPSTGGVGIIVPIGVVDTDHAYLFREDGDTIALVDGFFGNLEEQFEPELCVPTIRDPGEVFFESNRKALDAVLGTPGVILRDFHTISDGLDVLELNCNDPAIDTFLNGHHGSMPFDEWVSLGFLDRLSDLYRRIL